MRCCGCEPQRPFSASKSSPTCSLVKHVAQRARGCVGFIKEGKVLPTGQGKEDPIFGSSFTLFGVLSTAASTPGGTHSKQAHAWGLPSSLLCVRGTEWRLANCINPHAQGTPMTPIGCWHPQQWTWVGARALQCSNWWSFVCGGSEATQGPALADVVCESGLTETRRLVFVSVHNETPQGSLRSSDHVRQRLEEKGSVWWFSLACRGGHSTLLSRLGQSSLSNLRVRLCTLASSLLSSNCRRPLNGAATQGQSR